MVLGSFADSALSAPVGEDQLLFVTASNGSTTSQEDARVTLFSSWGYTVNMIWAGASQATFDAAWPNNDVAYVNEEIISGDLNSKLRLSTIGVLIEEPYNADDFGVSNPGVEVKAQTLTNVSTTHPITASFGSTSLTIFSSTQGGTYLPTPLAAGAVVLAEWSGQPAMVAIERGGALFNTINSNSTAAGRRVHLPWGWGDNIDFNALNRNGQQLVRNAIEWAADTFVGHWKLDETSGATAVDSSTYGNDGTFTRSPTLGVAGAYPGEVATAVDFDGSNDHVTLGNLDVTGYQITLAAWINADSFSGSASRIVAKANGSGLSNNYWSLTTYSSGGSNFLGILFKTDSGGTIFIPSSTEALEIGEWTHVAAVYNGSTIKLYKNGVEIYSTSVAGDITSGPTIPVWIAGSPSNEKYFDGQIDDVRIYSRSLSAEEIAELYGLMGHWKMNEGTGTTAADSMAFGNDATLSGATWITDCTSKNVLAFDGVSDTAATNAAFDPPGIGAVAFWMQASGTPTVRERIFGVNGNWEVRLETTGKISFDLGASPYAGNEPFATDVIDDQDRWYHIVAAFNESDDSYEVYVNGELQASGISPVDLVTQTAGILSFGTRTGSSENWKGSLRDFRVYNRWLSNDEISDLSGIIAHWNLEETVGTVAVDSGVAGNDASYVGAPVLGVDGPFLAKTGLAVELDGASTSVATGKSLLNNLTEFSLAVWIRPDSVTPNISILGQNGLIELGISSQTNQIEFWTNAGGSVAASGYLSLGKWAHVAAVGDSVSVRLYVNGAEVAAGRSSTANYGSNRAFFKIGEGVLAPSGDYFSGRVDDVRVYSRVMCLEEVRALYKGGRPSGVRILKWVEVR